MELVILGSGTGIPSAQRASPGLVLSSLSKPILFDLGPGCLRQLSRIGIDYNRLGIIFITHFHPDHTADLIHFLFATRNPSTLHKREPFVVAGPKGLKDFISDLQKAYGNWLDVPPQIMKINELEITKPDTKVFGGIEVSTQPLPAHTAESLAYRVCMPSGKVFVYSGDTGYCEELVDISKGADVLILESSFPDRNPVEGHLTPSEAGRVATLGRAKKLVLVHFYPEVLATDIASECRRTFKGELVLGRDLLHLSI